MSTTLETKLAIIKERLENLQKQFTNEFKEINKKLDTQYLPVLTFDEYKKTQEKNHLEFEKLLDEKYGMPVRVIKWIGYTVGGVLLSSGVLAILWAISQSQK